MSDIKFHLQSHQVPSPPTSTLWVDLLRWTVCVMDPKDTRLAFIASCLSYAIKNGGLTDAQAEACENIHERVRDAFMDGTLVCQNTIAPRPKSDGPALSVVSDKGEQSE